ncbi:ABC transporter transmembrane domain-containing protein [Actinokineospora guangxiensis]|uniref:ABC transporter transmembrane domain-containing protein n=1 Tax=Actinokineospora guangxiensis TaxID=1490288 RepID=A0ABW0EU49_9PSEU
MRIVNRRVVLASVLASAHQAGEALVPVVVGLVIDQATAARDGAALLWWLLALAGAFALLSFSFRFGHRAAERAAMLGEHRIRLAVVDRVVRGAPGKPGELVHVATGDARRIGLRALFVPVGVAALVGLAVAAVALLRMSVPLGVLVVASAAVVAGLTRVLSRRLAARGEREQERAARAVGVAADLVAGLRVVKGIGAETAAHERYRAVSQDALRAAAVAGRTRGALDGLVTGLNGLFLAAIALVGGNLALSGAISVGDLVAAVGLAQFAVWPLTALAAVAGELAVARGSVGRVRAVLDAPDAAPEGGAPLGEVAGEVVVDGLHVRAGEHIGVVTDDPAALLARLSRESGTFTLDGRDVAAHDVAEVRSAVVVSPHQVDLFAEDTTDDEPALAAVGARPDWTPAALSGGQRQRLALARALATRAPVLVLHDPTTAVDSVTEAAIAAAVRDLRAGATTIVVTTSPTLLAHTDRVHFGPLAGAGATGSHTDLLRDSAAYRAAVLG